MYPSPCRDVHTCGELAVGTERNADVIQVGARRPSAVALRDIRRNRHRGFPNLARQPVEFNFRKVRRCSVALLYEIHAVLPGDQVSVCEDV